MTGGECIWVGEGPGSEVSSHSSQWLSFEAIAQVLLQCWVSEMSFLGMENASQLP